MNFQMPSHKLTLWLLSLLILIGIGTFVYNQYLISNLLKKERSSIELWAKAIEYYGSPQNVSVRQDLNSLIEQLDKLDIPDEQQKAWKEILMKSHSELANAALDFVANELVIKNRFEIPSVVVDDSGIILNARYLNRSQVDSSLLKEFKQQNEPLKIEIGQGDDLQTQYVYYGESPMVKKLRLFPYVQIGLLALLLGIGFFSYNSVRKTEQSNLWVGMAKEAAHQLGTPLSGLYGWIAVLKDLHKDDTTTEILKELENDTARLQSIANRFNKIGSLPELENCDISPILDEIVQYMHRRLPQLGKKVALRTDIKQNIIVPVNPELFKWAIENLVKNAMDAINKTHDEAYVSITAKRIEDDFIIDIEDSGIGIDKKNHKSIFKPGFSTKKRGWGLGLSLTKRIIEQYHNGEICVLESEPGKGTTFRIMLPVKT